MSARSRTPSDADGITRRTFLVGAAGLPLAARARPGPAAFGAEVPAAWFDLALDLVRTTPGFSPPVAARAFAYAGIALHEAVMPRPLRLSGLSRPRRDGSYHWPSAANGALATILRRLFPTTPEWNPRRDRAARAPARGLGALGRLRGERGAARVRVVQGRRRPRGLPP
jgi:hypothetical protein